MGTVLENKLWDDILRSLERNVNPQIFESWFAPVKLEGCDPVRQLLMLRAPTQVVKDWITSNYTEVVRQSLAELNLGAYTIEWTIGEQDTAVSLNVVDEIALDATGSDIGGVRSKSRPSLYSLLETASADGLLRKDQPYVE